MYPYQALTYQDLLEASASASEEKLSDFVRDVISRHTQSDAYRIALDNKAYYDGENPTINRYEKVIFDLAGKAQKDMWTANHKIASNFFWLAVNQLTRHLLGNGVTFQNSATKKRLGADFDQQMMRAASYAQIGGVCYVLYNVNRVIPFSVQEFAPLKDAESGALSAGVRFWRLAEGFPLSATLYEPDGFSVFAESRDSRELRLTRPKTPYKLIRRVSGISAEVIAGENYSLFPIVPLRYTDDEKSAMNGKRNTIDALDLARSKMINNTDEGNLIYWVLKDYGGMGDIDLAEFVYRIKTLRAVTVRGAQDTGDDVEAHPIEAPFAGTQATIDGLIKQLYEDFQCFDASAVTAGNQSATAVRASYIPLDLKADNLEEQVTRCILGLLQVAGIAEDVPTYTRNPLVNVAETVQSLIMAAQYTGDDYTTEKLLTVFGDADRVDEILRKRDADALSRLGGAVDDDGGDDADRNGSADAG